MANLRNEFEFRSALLTALGQEHTEAEAKNEEMWRRKMLDGLGVEYDQNDVNQFGLFREKLIEGVTNYSGGGSGGGGESDFSTAEVTIIWDTSEGEDLLSWENCPTIISDLVTGAMYTEISPAVITVPLYKGKCYWERGTKGLTLSGNIEEYNDGEGMLITGDCTITIS